MSGKDEWNKVAEIYSTPHVRKTEIRAPALLAILGDAGGKSVLDLGCGDGYYSRLLAEKGARVVGVDFSEISIGIAMKHEKQKSLGIKYIQTDITSAFPLEDCSFDAVVADMVLVTISSQNLLINTISEVRRVLKKGGMVLISDGHPVDFARKDRSGHYVATYTQGTNYFTSPAPYKVRLEIGSRSVEWTNYHRTLGDLINPWIENDFTLIGVIEPKPTSASINQYPDYLLGTDQLPRFIIFKLVKN
ncbi:MAG: class I SAM-dependent methyltransferase [Patescibacteria group bacterium]